MQAQAPSADISLPVNADLCAPSTITFTNPTNVTTGNPAGTTYTYIVITGCEPPDTTVIPHTTPFTPFTYTFQRSSCDLGCATPQPGNFQVIMQASNASGSATDTLNVPIASNGTLGFSAPLTANASELVCLTDTSANGYYWNPTTQTCGDNTYWGIMPGTVTMVSGTLGNQTTPGSAVPCVRFNQSGTYMVALIRPAGACPSDTLKKTITVKPPCDSLAHFTWSTQCNSVQFTPVYPEPGATYNWTFGDGGISNEVNPSHIYFTQVGSQYMVRLIIVSGSCIDTFTATVAITIIAGGLPVASMQSLGVGITLKDDFLNCNASNTSTTSDDFNLNVQNTSQNIVLATTYEITWGDNSQITTLSTFNITNHLYTQMGLYDIILVAQNPNGCADTARYEFFNGREPAAGIGVPSSASLHAPTTIVFDNTPSVISQNPSGTMYVYTVRTDCQPLFTKTIPHTDPFTPFSYTFLRGSCEPECLLSDFPGQFVVTMKAENQCGTQEGDIKPRISKSGDADFDIENIASIGNLTCLINSSDTSYYWNSATQTCSSTMFNFWSVNPSAGVIVESGSLGNMQIPILGTDTVCLRFTSPGLFQVQFISVRPLVADSSCPSDTITKTISVVAVSTNEPSLEQQIRIIPNPARGHCTLEASPDLEVQSCSVYNMSGMLLLEQAFDLPPYKIDLSGQASDIYVLHILMNNGRSVVKRVAN